MGNKNSRPNRAVVAPLDLRRTPKSSLESQESPMSLRTALERVSPGRSARTANRFPADGASSGSSSDATMDTHPQLHLLTVDPARVPNVICKDTPTYVYVYDVYDGDTVHFLMEGGPLFPVIKLSLRLLGIDTPELRAGEGRIPEEKMAAEIARDRLAQLIGARARKGSLTPHHPEKIKLTQIIIRDWDKFGGRVLGEIILPDDRSAATVLISEGYGRPYNGEKKRPWTMADFTAPPFNML